MRLVAGIARKTGRMFRGHHLWKAFWLGAIGLVTARAQDRRVGKFRNYGSRVLGVPRQGAMARFAPEPGVLAFGLDFGVIRVAGLAHFASGERDGPGTDVVHGRRPEMPVFTEVRRHDRSADQ